MIEAIKDSDPNNQDQQEKLASHFQELWEKSEANVRIKEGISLINKHLSPKLSPSSLKAVKSWMEKTQENFKEKPELKDPDPQDIYAEVSQELDDRTCLKDTFGLDHFFMENAFKLGQEFLESKEYENAASVFTTLAFLDSLSPEIMISLAFAERGLGKIEEAETKLGVALFLAPEDPSTIYYVGRYYLDKGDRKTAKGFFQVIINSNKATFSMKEHCQKLIA